jgi:hypothetical protein
VVEDELADATVDLGDIEDRLKGTPLEDVEDNVVWQAI